MTVQDVPTEAPMSPTQAGKAVGVDRKTIMRAIPRQHFKAWRDNLNQWQIDRVSLREYAAVQWPAHGRKVPVAHVDPYPAQSPAHPIADGLALELAVLRERLEGAAKVEAALRERAETAERSGGAWREEATAAREREARERERADRAEKGREAAERERDAPRERRPKGLLRRLLGV